MKTIISLLLAFSLTTSSFGQAQKTDSLQLRAIYNGALTQGEAYENLRYLCKNIGPRLSGSDGANRAVEWGYELLSAYEFDRVWKQEIMVPHWERGAIERCEVINKKGGNTPLAITALGGSIGTHGLLKGEVIEFNSLKDLKSAYRKEVEGKIVFINQPMDQTLITTFRAYGSCAGIRVWGAVEASKKGAVAVINRSLATNDDDHPHTGVMIYNDSIPAIPGVAIGIESADLLSKQVAAGKCELQLELECKTLPDTPSFNIIGEITGSEYPDEYMVVGGHLDSWDIGEGAHDDGAGVVQSIEVLRLFKALNIRPKRTLRCVLFMNEENGNRGGKGYAKRANEKDEKHFLAIESDRGGFVPRGFSIDAASDQIKAIQEFSPLFEPYLSDIIVEGYGGVDINPLKPQGTVLIGFTPDSQRYFDLHHSANDVFEAVNKRELHLGAASMASLIYLVDKYGLPQPIKP